MDKKWVKKIEKNIPSHMPNPNPAFRLNVFAPSYSGKSFAINDLLTNPKYGYSKVFKPDQIFIMSPTYETDESYKDLKKVMEGHEQNVVDHYDEDFILAILDFQKKKKREKKARPVLLLVDDLITTINQKRQNEMVNIYIRARHQYVSCILTSQKYKLVNSPIRVNACSNIYFSNRMNRKELNDISEECPDNFFYELAKDLRRNNHFDYDFIFMNLKKPFSQRYYRNWDKCFKIDNNYLED
jgi:hypothetical protein